MSCDELQVVLRKSENLGYGFSLLGISGLPHVIYDIVEHSPAAECEEVRTRDAFPTSVLLSGFAIYSG